MQVLIYDVILLLRRQYDFLNFVYLLGYLVVFLLGEVVGEVFEIKMKNEKKLFVMFINIKLLLLCFFKYYDNKLNYF